MIIYLNSHWILLISSALDYLLLITSLIKNAKKLFHEKILMYCIKHLFIEKVKIFHV